MASVISKLSFKIASYPFRSKRITPPEEDETEKDPHQGWVSQHPAYVQAYTIANQMRKSRYHPKKFNGHITTFVAVVREDLNYLYLLNEPDLGWKRLAREVDSAIIDGDHRTIMDMPNVLPLAREIDRHLR